MRVIFFMMAEPGSKVFLAGTFNNWDSKAHQLKESFSKGVFSKGVFMTQIDVPFGRHEYKFIVNNIWQTDSSCSSQVSNQFGSKNSVISVKSLESRAKTHLNEEICSFAKSLNYMIQNLQNTTTSRGELFLKV